MAIKPVSGLAPPLRGGKAVPAQHDDPEADFSTWLLGLHHQGAAASDVPPGQDDPVRKLATRLAGCVAAGCLSGTDRLTALEVAAHIGGHSPGGRMPAWALTGLRQAERLHRDSLRADTEAGADISAVCGACGRWQTRAQFERNGGCCSRRAVDHGNRWPGEPAGTGGGPRSGWGPWTLHVDDRLAPWLENQEWTWEVNLAECNTPYRALNAVLQVAEKAWADDRTTAGRLARALNVVLGARSNLCERRDNPRMAVDLIRLRATKLANHGVMCGACEVTKTREQFERDGGCCARRAEDFGNRWPGEG